MCAISSSLLFGNLRLDHKVQALCKKGLHGYHTKHADTSFDSYGALACTYAAQHEDVRRTGAVAVQLRTYQTHYMCEIYRPPERLLDLGSVTRTPLLRFNNSNLLIPINICAKVSLL